jgi:DNA-binding XRE family transcriptional regulator
MIKMTSRLKEARLEAKLSEEGLARQVKDGRGKTGVSRQTIRLIEAGEMVPNLFMAMSIAELVKKDIEWLFATKTQPIIEGEQN